MKYKYYGCYALRSVYCLNPSPPELDTNVFPSELKPWSLPAKAQQQDDGKCRLYVPAGSGSQYARKWQWPNNLVEEVQDMDFITGIDETTINTPVMPTAYYNELGQPLTEPKKGLVIVRYSDGTTRKIMVK